MRIADIQFSSYERNVWIPIAYGLDTNNNKWNQISFQWNWKHACVSVFNHAHTQIKSHFQVYIMSLSLLLLLLAFKPIILNGLWYKHVQTQAYYTSVFHFEELNKYIFTCEKRSSIESLWENHQFDWDLFGGKIQR